MGLIVRSTPFLASFPPPGGRRQRRRKSPPLSGISGACSHSWLFAVLACARASLFAMVNERKWCRLRGGGAQGDSSNEEIRTCEILAAVVPVSSGASGTGRLAHAPPDRQGARHLGGLGALLSQAGGARRRTSRAEECEDGASDLGASRSLIRTGDRRDAVMVLAFIAVQRVEYPITMMSRQLHVSTTRRPARPQRPSGGRVQVQIPIHCQR